MWVAQFVGLAMVRWMWMGFGKCGWVPAGVAEFWWVCDLICGGGVSDL